MVDWHCHDCQMLARSLQIVIASDSVIYVMIYDVARGTYYKMSEGAVVPVFPLRKVETCSWFGDCANLVVCCMVCMWNSILLWRFILVWWVFLWCCAHKLFTFCLPLLERSVSIMFAVGYGDCFAPLSCKFWAVFKRLVCVMFCWLFHGLVIVSSMLCTACVAKCWKQDATHEPECSHVC